MKNISLNSITLLIFFFILSSSVFAQTSDGDFDDDDIHDSIDIDDDNDGIPDIDEGLVQCYNEVANEKVGNFDGTFEFLVIDPFSYVLSPIHNQSRGGFTFVLSGNWYDESPVPLYPLPITGPLHPVHFLNAGSGLGYSPDRGHFIVSFLFLVVNSGTGASREDSATFYTDLTGLEIGQTYSLVFYSTNAGLTYSTEVGDITYWQVCFGNDCRDAPDKPFEGFGSQTWDFTKMEFKASSANVRLRFTAGYRTAINKGNFENNALAIDCIDVLKGTVSENDIRPPPGTIGFKEIDTDGDGQPNHRDLDSDNDGCYDSYEGGVTGSTNNGTVTDSLATTNPADVGSNGLVDRLETNTDNGELSYIPTYDKYAIVDTLNLCDNALPGCLSDTISLWLRGDEGLNLTDGNAVNTWEDQSGVRSNNATSAIMDPPTFRNNAVNNINYNPVVEFDGTDDGLNYGDDYIFTSADKGGVTIFSIIRPDVSSNSTPFIYDFGNKGVKNLGMVYGNDNISIMTPIADGGRVSSAAHTLGTKPALMTMDVNFGNSQLAYLNRLEIINSAITLSNLEGDKFYEASNPGIDRGPVSIGRQSQNNSLTGNLFDGAIAEIIFYGTNLSSQQIHQIETYLAVKYGITLGNSSSPKDYVIGGDTVWKANSAYQNNIFGIGREDCTDLHQQIARSSNNDVITISTDNNFTNQNGSHDIIPKNSNYLIIGNDGKTIDWSDEELFSSSGMARTTREWNVQITGTEIDSIYISVDGSKLAYVPSIAKIYLMVDKDGDFRRIPYYGYEMTRNAASNTWELKHAFSDGDYFTIVIDYGIPHMRHGLRFKFSQQQPLNRDSGKIYKVE